MSEYKIPVDSKVSVEKKIESCLDRALELYKRFFNSNFIENVEEVRKEEFPTDQELMIIVQIARMIQNEVLYG